MHAVLVHNTACVMRVRLSLSHFVVSVQIPMRSIYAENNTMNRTQAACGPRQEIPPSQLHQASPTPAPNKAKMRRCPAASACLKYESGRIAAPRMRRDVPNTHLIGRKWVYTIYKVP